jgi:hypothetical protein
MVVSERDFGSLEEAVRNLTSQWKHQDDAAMRGRRAVYERLEALTTKVAVGDEVLKSLQSDMAEIKADIKEKIMPTIEAYKLDKAHRGGFFSFGKGMWIAITALFGSGVAIILKIWH